MYKLCFYVPESHLEAVKEAVFATGAGRIGDYDSCCWQVRGDGQFRPLEGSRPFLGSPDRVEHVSEFRVELVCDEQTVRPAIAALYRAHPYEEPAWDAIALANQSLR